MIFGLSIGDLLVLLMTSVFSGGLLNQWVFKRFPNHNVYKLSVTFGLVLLLSALNLFAEGSTVNKELTFYLALICGGILLGVIADLAVDKFVVASNSPIKIEKAK